MFVVGIRPVVVNPRLPLLATKLQRFKLDLNRNTTKLRRNPGRS